MFFIVAAKKRDTNYRIPKKQLGFGSSNKYSGNEPTSGKKEKPYPKFFYEQALLILQTNSTDINKIINKNIRNNNLLRDEASIIAYELLVKACSSYKKHKTNTNYTNTNYTEWVLYKFKCYLLNWYRKRLLHISRALMLDAYSDIDIEARNTDQINGDEKNKELADILLEYIKRKTLPHEFQIYYLSYRLGLSDVEIACRLFKDRSRVTRIRNNVVQIIIDNKAEIEALFNEHLE